MDHTFIDKLKSCFKAWDNTTVIVEDLYEQYVRMIVVSDVFNKKGLLKRINIVKVLLEKVDPLLTTQYLFAIEPYTYEEYYASRQ